MSATKQKMPIQDCLTIKMMIEIQIFAIFSAFGVPKSILNYSSLALTENMTSLIFEAFNLYSVEGR